MKQQVTRPGRWLALGVLVLAVLLVAVDATVLGLATPFLTEDLRPSGTQLLWIGDAYSFVLAGLLVSMGSLGDRIGRWKVFLGGHLALVLALLVVSGPLGSWWLVLALHGAFYAATDGVLPAAVGPLLPEHLRASGLAVLQTGQALARMAAAVTVGLLWTLWDLRPAMLTFTAGLLAVTLAAAVFKPLEVRRFSLWVQCRQQEFGDIT